jgi:hypothetical protein
MLVTESNRLIEWTTSNNTGLIKESSGSRLSAKKKLIAK